MMPKVTDCTDLDHQGSCSLFGPWRVASSRTTTIIKDVMLLAPMLLLDTCEVNAWTWDPQFRPRKPNGSIAGLAPAIVEAAGVCLALHLLSRSHVRVI